MKKIILCFLLSSCTSTMVTTPTNSAYAPVNYKPLGEVKYLNRGADAVILSRREDAFKQMYLSCNGKYQIVEEGSSGDYWTVRYECM